MRIALLANLKRNAPARPDAAARSAPPADAWAELDSDTTIEAILAVLERAGHTVAFFEGDLGLVEALPRFRPDLCFNLCEGHFGTARESHVPALLELMRVPYTGSDVLALALSLDKPMTKRVLSAHGLPTPPGQVMDSPDAALDPALRFPLFVKPAREGSGIGVSAQSIVADERQLRRRVGWLIDAYQQPALVERFIRGREITIGMIGNRGAPVLAGAWQGLPIYEGLAVLPPYEVAMAAGEVYTSERKSGWQGDWSAGRHYHCPARLGVAQQQELSRLCAATFHATGCRDVARVDLRLDADDGERPYVLEINALPGISPGWSDMVFEAAAAGLCYDDLVLGIVSQAAYRLGLPAGRAADGAAVSLPAARCDDSERAGSSPGSAAARGGAASPCL